MPAVAAKGGGVNGAVPPEPLRGGQSPPGILASKKSKEDLEELCYFIHIILNPNDPTKKIYIYKLLMPFVSP